MERYLIFAFVLFAALSMVNAMPAMTHQLNKRTTNFGPCPFTPPPSPITVSLNPDPIVAGQTDTFSVSGKAIKDIPAYSVLSVTYVDGEGTPIIPKANADFCSSPGITCPMVAGTQFSTYVDFSVPNDLPASYEIIVVISDPKDPDPEPSNYLGCAISAVGFTQV